jgi:hypothetical protein
MDDLVRLAIERKVPVAVILPVVDSQDSDEFFIAVFNTITNALERIINLLRLGVEVQVFFSHSQQFQEYLKEAENKSPKVLVIERRENIDLLKRILLSFLSPTEKVLIRQLDCPIAKDSTGACSLRLRKK